MLETKQLKRIPFPLLKAGALALGVVIVAAVAAVMLAAWWMKAPFEDLGQLFVFLLLSGGLSALFILGWMSYVQKPVGLRLQLIVTYLTGAVVTMVNVLITSGLMFLSAHDEALLTLLLIFSAALSVFFAFLLSNQLAHQVHALKQGARAIAEGKLDTRVAVGGSHELAELAETFNCMAGQLEKAFASQREMERARKELVAAISHDLRTPLASLRLMTEAISDGVADEKQTAVFLERMRSEVQYMTGLIEDLFELSQLDAGALKLSLEQASLSDLISDTLESLQGQAAKKSQTLQGELLDELPEFCFDPRKIQRVLNNLVGNAIRYTPEGGKIWLTARRANTSILVSVKDTGDGIAADDQAKIFEPFFRSERSRGREHGGAGLGLAIARGLLEAHGGKIWVESREGAGSTFTFELPLKPPPK